MGEKLLITEAYREMQRRLHENPNYGVASVQYAPLVAQVIEARCRGRRRAGRRDPRAEDGARFPVLHSGAMGEKLLITEAYREMQRRLHENPNYGVASVQYAPLVAQVIEAVGADELLDYGAGKGRLGETLARILPRPIRIRHYDPAIPEWSAPPEPCAFVACIDVLEHIEPELLDNVLDDLARVTAGVGLFTVHTGPAAKHLPDGRNAHLIQQPAAWWLPKILARFELVRFDRMPQGFWVGVERRAG